MSGKPQTHGPQPQPGRCGLHGKVLEVPVKMQQQDGGWICIVCIVNLLWNDEVTKQVQKNWPMEFKLGPLALQHYEKTQGGGVKRKGATGV